MSRKKKKSRASAECCPRKPSIEARELITAKQTAALSSLFKVFANETRLRLLHALVRAEELCVTDLAETLGMKPQAVSNQLQRLSDKGVVASRRNGNNVLYRIADPCVPALLDQGLCLLEDADERKRSAFQRETTVAAQTGRR